MNLNVRNLKIFLGLMLLMLIALAFSAQAADYEAIIGEDNIIEDGFITTNVRYNALTKTDFHFTANDRGYTEWNISEIQDEAQIEYIHLYWYTLDSSSCGVNNVYINDLYWQPSAQPLTTTGNSTIHTDCGNGTTYLKNDGGTFPDNVGARSYNFTASPTITHFEENLSRDWWGIGYTGAAGCPAWNLYGEMASKEHATQSPMYLKVGYNLTAPQINTSNTIPTDGTTDVNLTPELSINISHDDGVQMSIAWYFYNGTDFYLVHNHTSVSNGVYTWNYSNATQPCTTYYWYVHVEDPLGNYTERVYEFTTFCVDPPTNLVCKRVNNTMLNISFTELNDHNGTTHTIVKYKEGYTAPTWSTGTNVSNTTYNYTWIGNLSEGVCYSISAWTYWMAPNGTYYLSGSKASITCCTEGGDYRICLFYEETQEMINLTHYPFGRHRLRAYLEDGTVVTRYLDDSWYYNNSNCSCINISVNDTVLYFELWWNHSHTGNQLTCSYIRKLLPESRKNCTACSYQSYYTIKFYLVTDRHLYNEYYYNSSGTALLETDMHDNLVQYAYSFEDRTQLFQTSSDAYASFYCYNDTSKLVIHQEYWDASQKVYPTLLHHKHYFVGVNDSNSDTDEYTNIGLAPTEDTVEETIVINPREIDVVDISSVFRITFGWQSGATGLWVDYEDTSGNTNWVNCTITDTNTSFTTSNNKTLNEYNFTFNSAYHNETYFILLTISHKDFDILVKIPLYLSPNETYLSTTAQINAYFENIFGLAPLYNLDTGEQMDWASMIVLSACMIAFLVFIKPHPPLAIFSPGLILIVSTILISGFPLGWIGVGALLIFSGIAYSIAGGKKE